MPSTTICCGWQPRDADGNPYTASIKGCEEEEECWRGEGPHCYPACALGGGEEDVVVEGCEAEECGGLMVEEEEDLTTILQALLEEE